MRLPVILLSEICAASAAAPLSVFAAGKEKSAVKVDQRTFDFCKAKGGSFVQINDCLPKVQVAFVAMDAIAKEFGPKAQPLLDKCLELNEKDAVGAATCSLEAIKNAVELKGKLPDGADLNDELFNAIADEAKFKSVKAAETKAQELFPEIRIWGGNFYQPYKL